MDLFNGINILIGLDLLFLGVVVTTTCVLGFLVFVNNRRSATNQSFLLFALITIFLSIINYLTYQEYQPEASILALWFLRIAMFFAVWHAFSFFQFCYIFPREEVKIPRHQKIFIIPATFFVSILTLTQFIFPKIKSFTANGRINEVESGSLIPIFGLLVLSLVFSGIFILFRKTQKAIDKTETLQLRLVFAGTLITFCLIIFFNFILPTVFGISQFVSFLTFFLLPFIGFTFYAITKYHLFKIKVIATELLVFVVWVVIVVDFLTKTSLRERVLEGIVLSLMVVFGILLIKSVRKEVSRREEFELLSKELGAANEKLKELDQMKTDFISIASHQLRTPLTAIKGYSSMLLEDTYGELPLKVRGTVEKVFQSAQRLIFIVNDLLDTSRIEQGRLQVSFERVEVANIIKDVVEELKPNAETRGIQLQLEMSPDDAEIVVQADPSKLRQVVTNLIDNAIKYTEQGSVTVALRKTSGGNRALISVKDTGFGMSAQSMQNLFQKFSRAKNVSKLHVDGSGLGLFIAKQIIEAHNGRIWAESAGENKGSQFYVELPMG